MLLHNLDLILKAYFNYFFNFPSFSFFIIYVSNSLSFLGLLFYNTPVDTLKTRDIIFFDWIDSNNGQADYVGIIERVENNKVYTIEGNTRGDMCKQNEYDINSSVILGYRTLAYQ